MKRVLLAWCCIIIVITGCQQKEKVPLTGEEPVQVEDLIDFFDEVELPFTVADSNLNKKQTDSSLIAYTVFTEFVPDSVLRKDFGKAKPKIYPMGKVSEKGKETYLFVKAVQGTKRVGYIICFDKTNQYLNTLPIVRTGWENHSSIYGSLDKKFQITTYRAQKNKAGEETHKKNVFIYNSVSNDFTLIFTEPNVEIIEELINPIDTLPQKHKYTGDYVVNKKNLVSFRDGKKTSEILFFVHLEKDKGECAGELKGVARFVSATKAVYKEIGNPCTIEFSFTASKVTMKEVEGCGSYRGIKCFFNGVYPKKKIKQSKK